jgi:hypothetical protein
MSWADLALWPNGGRRRTNSGPGSQQVGEVGGAAGELADARQAVQAGDIGLEVGSMTAASSSSPGRTWVDWSVSVMRFLILDSKDYWLI